MQISDILSSVDHEAGERYARSVCAKLKGKVRLGLWVKTKVLAILFLAGIFMLSHLDKLTGLLGMLLMIVILLGGIIAIMVVFGWSLEFDGETGWMCQHKLFGGTTRFHVSEINAIWTDTVHASGRGLFQNYDRLRFRVGVTEYSVVLRSYVMRNEDRDQTFSGGDLDAERFYRYLDLYARYLSEPEQGLRPPDTGKAPMPFDADKLAEGLLAQAPRLPKYKPRMRGMGEIIDMPNPRTAGSGSGSSFLAEMMQQYNVSESSVANFSAGIGSYSAAPKKAVSTAASVPALQEITDMTDIPALAEDEIPDVSDGKAIREKPITEALPSVSEAEAPEQPAQEQPRPAKPEPAIQVTPESMAKMRLPQSFGEQPAAFPDPTAQGFPDPAWRPDPAAPAKAPEPAPEQSEPAPALSEPAPAPTPAEKPPVDVDALFNKVLAEHGKSLHPEKPKRRGLFGR